MDGKLRTERVVLLGLVIILGATGNVLTAAVALAISALAALLVCGVGRLVRTSETVTEFVRWSILFTVGFGVAWIAGSLASYLLPIPERAVLYLRIAGLSPIVYYAVARRGASPAEGALRESLLSWVVFAVILLGTGLVREVFGRGTVLGFLIVTGWTIPADFLASPVGAFLVAGAIILGSRVFAGVSSRTGATTEGGRG